MRSAALALLLLPPAALADCGPHYERMSLAYRAYNECSAAGRGAAGCASESAAYDAARAQLDSCYERRREASQPNWPASTIQREYERPERPERESGSAPYRFTEPRRGR
jgi:hypothetical protein